MKLQPGITLQGGKYLLNQTLGQGGVGATYLATQTLLKQAIVIKTLDPSWQVTQSFPQLKAYFIEDMRRLACSQHSSIVRVFDFFQEESLPFLVMEYIPGQTLYDRVTAEGPFSEVEAIHYIRQIGSALCVAHRHGLIHHNLSPKTIIRRPGTNLAILVGFGLGHDLAATQPVSQNPFAPPTPNWGEGNRFAIDLYALSATLYYLLTGEVPKSDLTLDQSHWLNATKHAIVRGLTASPQWQLQTIEDWLKLLPNTSLPLMAAHSPEPGQPQNTNSPPLPSPTAKSAEAVTRNGTPTGTPTNGAAKPTSPTLPGVARTAVNGSIPAKLTTPSPENRSTPAATSIAVKGKSQTLVKQPLIFRSMGNERHLPKFLLLTIAAATAMGAGFGLALRISATKTPGTSILHPAQAFEEKEWKGTLTVKDTSDAPTENTPANFRNQIPVRQPKSSDPVLAPLPIVPSPLPTAEYPTWNRPIVPNPITPRANKPQPVEPAVPDAPSAPAIDPVPPRTSEKPGVSPSIDSSRAPLPPTAPNSNNNLELQPTTPTR